MSAWEAVLASALVGTERRPPPSDALAVIGLVDSDVASAEQSAPALVLKAAAALSTWRRAGYVPPSVDPADVPPPAPEDGRRPPSPAAAQVLELLLHANVWLPCGPKPLVEQWLTQAAAHGWAVPDRLLPLVLENSVNDRSLIDLLGGRGRWLAAQDERWTQAFGVWADDEERFRTGTGIERVQALADLRRRDPAEARAVLEEAWPQEKASQRIDFLRTLATGLSMDDEPFLEAALDDRSGPVREAAAGLLRRLPDSRLCQRMTARALPLVQVTGRLRKRIDVEFPSDPDAAARRDGVTDVGPPERTGLAGWWLIQLVRATPLTQWELALGVTPGEAVRLASDQPELLSGWRRAASYQHDVRWAAALFPVVRQPDLLGALSADQAVAVVQPLLEGFNHAEAARAMVGVRAAWPASFSEAALGRAQRMPAAAVESVAPVLAAALDPSVAPAVEQWALSLADDDRTRRFVRGVHHALTLRDTIRKELS